VWFFILRMRIVALEQRNCGFAQLRLWLSSNADRGNWPIVLESY
jgi:hypothetical protein